MMNKKLAVYLFIALFEITHMQFANASIYYVDSSGGNDANPGTSVTAPWQTLQHVNNTQFSPGDSILLKRGQVWREALLFKSSGTEGGPIVLGSYGTGSRPTISGGQYFGKNSTWRSEGNGEWRLEVGSTVTHTSSIPIFVRGDGSGDVSTYKAVLRSDTRGILTENEFYTEAYSGVREIVYRPATGEVPQDFDFEVAFRTDTAIIEADHVKVQGIKFLLSSPFSTGVVTVRGEHVNLDDVVAQFSASFGIVCDGVRFCKVSNSLAEFNKSTGIYILKPTATDCIVEYSTSRFNGTHYADGDRGGIGVQGARAIIRGNRVESNGNTIGPEGNGDFAISVFEADNVTVERNYIKNAATGGILISYSPLSYGSKILYNVINEYNITNQGVTNKSSGITIAGYKNTDNSGLHRVEGNVIYSMGSSSKLTGISVLTPYSDDYSKNSSVVKNVIFFSDNTDSNSNGYYFSRGLSSNPNLSLDSNWIEIATGNQYYIGGSYYRRKELPHGLEANEIVVDQALARYRPIDAEAIALLETIFPRVANLPSPPAAPPLLSVQPLD